MRIYQAEEGQIGLTLEVILTQRDLDQIIGHNPLNIDIDPLRISVSFCEPSKSAFFDIDRRIYFISLCNRELEFLKGGNSLVAIYMIEGIPFTINILFKKNLRDKSARNPWSYMLLSGMNNLGVTTMSHTKECEQQVTERTAAREAWANRWPYYCRTCDGLGASYSTYDPSPAGVALSPGYMVDVDPCPDCSDKGFCSRCGEKVWDPDSIEYPCPNCG